MIASTVWKSLGRNVIKSIFCHTYLALLIFSLVTFSVSARTRDVGTGQPYANAQLAAVDALPGDTILIHAGTYSTTSFISNLRGTTEAWITIRGADDAPAVMSGGSESLHLSDCAYLRIEHLIISGQTGNGMNIDDGGTIDSPTHHIVLSGVVFRDIAANGNNDLLKLSGLDTFEIRDCTFLNGAAGGSGIDMVGCHAGIIEQNVFTNLGSNAIQAKGGTASLQILRNRFTNAGERSVNLGGSTGLQFFRPIDAPYEAADIRVYANVFVGSTAAIAYVGCTRVDVANNTIINPVRWVLRILQETVDTNRFIKCGHNQFRNNIVYTTDLESSHVNIGPYTDPTSFGFRSNLWYNSSDSEHSTPTLPSPEKASMVGRNPQFDDLATTTITLRANSPAIGAGTHISALQQDLFYVQYRNPPSIGASEGSLVSSYQTDDILASAMRLTPNPASEQLQLRNARGPVTVFNVWGGVCDVPSSNHYPLISTTFTEYTVSFDVSRLPSGTYVVRDSFSSALLVVRH